MNRDEVIKNGELILTCNHSKVRYYKYLKQIWAVYKKQGFYNIAYLCGSIGQFVPKSL